MRFENILSAFSFIARYRLSQLLSHPLPHHALCSTVCVMLICVLRRHRGQRRASNIPTLLFNSLTQDPSLKQGLLGQKLPGSPCVCSQCWGTGTHGCAQLFIMGLIRLAMDTQDERLWLCPSGHCILPKIVNKIRYGSHLGILKYSINSTSWLLHSYLVIFP